MPLDGERRQRHRRPLDPAERLAEHQDPVARDVERAGDVGHDRVPEHVDQVTLVQELQAWVEAQHGGHDGQPEVRRDRAVDVGADHVGGPDLGHAYVGPAAGEAADVALDLGDVLGVPGLGQPPRLHVLGEHGRVAVAGAVHRGRGLHHEVLEAGCLLAGREQLHGADDVELFHRVAAPGAAGGRDHAHVDDGVDVLLGDDLRDDGVPDVGAHERDVADVAARWDDIHTDDAADGRVRGGCARKPTTEVP